MPRSVWMLLGAALAIATMSTIALAHVSARAGVPREVFSLSLGVTIVAWIAVIVIIATQCIKAYIREQRAEFQRAIYLLITGATTSSDGHMSRKELKRHLHSVDS